MGDEQVGEVTILLRAVKDGHPGAADCLMKLVHGELKKIARNRVPATGPHDLEPTALVNEAYIRLFGKENLSWENRHHFFWAAARAMRDILVERARHEGALKRGGEHRRVELDDQPERRAEAADLLALSEAIRKLETVHPEAARIVMLRFFAGLTREQIAEITGQSPSAVWREWNFAKAWLHTELDGPAPVRGPPA